MPGHWHEIVRSKFQALFISVYQKYIPSGTPAPVAPYMYDPTSSAALRCPTPVSNASFTVDFLLDVAASCSMVALAKRSRASARSRVQSEITYQARPKVETCHRSLMHIFGQTVSHRSYGIRGRRLMRTKRAAETHSHSSFN